MVLKFVDVASHQGNYIVGSSGEEGVIVKATQGTWYVNENFAFVAQQLTNSNIPWGIYHYAEGGDVNAEADYFIQAVQGYLNGSNPPNLILDWEEYQNSAYQNGVWAETFLKRLKDKTGIQGGIYGNSDDLSQMTQWVVDNAWVWFAGYPYAPGTTQMIQDWNAPKFPYNKGKFKAITGWQFSSQPLDRSIFYLDTEGWTKLSGSDNANQNNNNSSSATEQNNNNSNSELEDDDLMKFTYEIIDAKTNKSQGTVYYYDGNKIVALSDKDQLKIIREIYKDTTGKSMKNYKWRTDAPWYVRFMQAINQKAVEVAWK